MRAIVQERYGPPDDVLDLRDVDPPVPREDEVLVRVHAASVHPDVWHVVAGRPYVVRLMGAGVLRPRQPIPGTDMSGVVEAVGRSVTRFRPGDAVYGETVRGHQWHNGGAFAELVAAPEARLLPKPTRLGFPDAAAVPTSGIIGLQIVRDEAGVGADQRVLVNGAGGSLGTFAVQLAKAFGAEVTAVDHGQKLDMLRSLGADHVIDYATTGPDAWRGPFDRIIDIASTASVADFRRALAPDGTYVLVGHDHYGAGAGRWLGSMGSFLKLLALTPFVPQLRAPRRRASARDAFATLDGLVVAGTVRPVVDRTFPLAACRQAMRHLASGRPLGKVVLTM